MVMQMTNVEDLITINQGFQGDRTLREFDQYLRVDLVKGERPKCQILFDRRHLQNPRLSKPVGYITFSSVNDVIALASNLYAAAFAMIIDGPEVPENRIKDIFDMQVGEVKQLGRKYLVAMEMARRKERMGGRYGR